MWVRKENCFVLIRDVERESCAALLALPGFCLSRKRKRALDVSLFRSEMERLEYDLLFRWFVGIGIDDPAWDHSVFSKNRDRLLEGDIAAKFLGVILSQPTVKRLLSTDHFSVDGTLIEAWAPTIKW